MSTSSSPSRRSLLTTLLLCATLSFNSCTRLPSGQVEWSAIGDESLTLIRIEPAPNNQFRFDRQGRIAASIIQPNGMVVAPILYWRAEGPVLIISEQPGGPALMTLAEPFVKDGILIATESNGLKAKFKYQSAYWPF